MTDRFLTASDIDEIVRVEKEVFCDGWNEAQLLSSFKSGRFYGIGCFDGAELLGFVTFSLATDTADIEDICTLKTHQRKGIAKILLGKAIEFIADKGIREIMLEVRESNVGAIALYNSFGFKHISVRKKYYGDGENALILKKEI